MGKYEGTFSAVATVVGIIFCVVGALLLGHAGVLGIAGWLLVLFGFGALIQAALARLGLYMPYGSRGDDDGQPQER
jgi:hypothetical protein